MSGWMRGRKGGRENGRSINQLIDIDRKMGSCYDDILK